MMYKFKHTLNWYMISLYFLGLFGTLVSLGMLGVSLGDVLLQVFRRPVALRHRGLSLDLPVASLPSVPISEKHEMRSLLLVSKISVLKIWTRFNENLSQKRASQLSLKTKSRRVPWREENSQDAVQRGWHQDNPRKHDDILISLEMTSSTCQDESLCEAWLGCHKGVIFGWLQDRASDMKQGLSLVSRESLIWGSLALSDEKVALSSFPPEKWKKRGFLVAWWALEAAQTV